MLVRKTCILFLFAALLGAGSLRAQQLSVEARIAGLESNEEYMSLLREDAQLQMREDSIVNAVERARRQLRENPAARQQYSQDILRPIPPLPSGVFGQQIAHQYRGSVERAVRRRSDRGLTRRIVAPVLSRFPPAHH